MGDVMADTLVSRPPLKLCLPKRKLLEACVRIPMFNVLLEAVGTALSRTSA